MSQTKAEITLSARDETQAAFRAVNSAMSNLGSQSLQMRDKAVLAFKGVAIAAAGLGTVTSMAGLIDGISKSVDAMGELKDSAERTGASVEKLSALKGVAKIGGRDFAEIEAGIGRLNKALHGTDDESKGAGKALAALGLDMQKLRDMDPADAMLYLAQAQEKFTDGGGKSAAMMAILGKNGAALIPYLHDLAETQKLVGKVSAQNARDADEYAKNVKRLEASWGNLSRQMGAVVVGPAKDITDWMLKAQREGGTLQAILVGIGAAMTKAFGGEINPLKQAEKDSAESFGRVTSLKKAIIETQAEIDSNLGGLLGKGIAKLRLSSLKDDLVKAEGELRSSTRRLKKLATEAVSADKPKDSSLDTQTFGKDGSEKGTKKSDDAAALISTLDKQIAVRALDLSTTEKLTAAEKQAAEVRQQLDSGTIKATTSQRALIDGKLEFLVAADKEIAKQNEFNAGLEKAGQAMLDHRQKMVESIVAAEDLATTYGLTESQLSAVTQARLEDALAIAEANGASGDTLDYLREEIALRSQLTDALIKVDQKRIEQQTSAEEKTNEFAQQAARNIQNSLADFLFDPFSKGSDKMIQKFGETLQRMAADAAAAQIGKALFGDLLGGGGKSGSSGGSGLIGKGIDAAGTWLSSINWASLFSFADGGIMTSRGSLPLKKYANGGIANSPQLAMFGEGRNPEAYVPLPDGRSIPVKMAGHGSAGNNITIHVNSSTGDKAEIRRSAAAGARAALGAMNGAQRYA